MKEGLEVEEGKVKLTFMVLVTLIGKGKLIIYGLGNLCICQIVMPKTPAEKQVLQKAGLGLKKIKFSVEMTKWQYITSRQERLNLM